MLINGSLPGHILGDSGYHCRSWLLTPFLSPRNISEERFNDSLAKTRVFVENSIRRSKRRYLGLHDELRNDISKIPKLIVAAACLWNECININYDVERDDREEDQTVGNHEDGNEQLLQLRRSEQSRAVQSVLAIGDHKKQKLVINELLSKMKNVLVTSKSVILAQPDFNASNKKLPVDEQMKEVVSKIIESTAFLAEFTLHFPQFVAQKIFAKDEQFREVYTWAHSFATNMSMYDEATAKMVNLAAQELSIIQKKDDYVNPYQPRKKPKEEIEREAVEKLRQFQEQKKADKAVVGKAKKKKNGPALSRTDL